MRHCQPPWKIKFQFVVKYGDVWNAAKPLIELRSLFCMYSSAAEVSSVAPPFHLKSLPHPIIECSSPLNAVKLCANLVTYDVGEKDIG